MIALDDGNSISRALFEPVTVKLPGPARVPVTAVEIAALYESGSDGVIDAVIEYEPVAGVHAHVAVYGPEPVVLIFIHPEILPLLF